MNRFSCLLLAVTFTLGTGCPKDTSTDPEPVPADDETKQSEDHEAATRESKTVARTELSDPDCQKLLSEDVVKRIAPEYDYVEDLSVSSLAGTCVLMKSPALDTSVQIMIPEIRGADTASAEEVWKHYVKQTESKATDAEIKDMKALLSNRVEIEKSMAQGNAKEIARIESAAEKELEDYKSQSVKSEVMELENLGQRAALVKETTSLEDKKTIDYQVYILESGVVYSISTTANMDEEFTRGLAEALASKLKAL